MSKPKTEMDMVIEENRKLTNMILELQGELKEKVSTIYMIKIKLYDVMDALKEIK